MGVERMSDPIMCCGKKGHEQGFQIVITKRAPERSITSRSIQFSDRFMIQLRRPRFFFLVAWPAALVWASFWPGLLFLVCPTAWPVALWPFFFVTYVWTRYSMYARYVTLGWIQLRFPMRLDTMAQWPRLALPCQSS